MSLVAIFLSMELLNHEFRLFVAAMVQSDLALSPQ